MWQVWDLTGAWEVWIPGAAWGARRVWVPEEPPVPLGEPAPPAVTYRRRFHLDVASAAAPAARLELGGVLGRAGVRLNGRPVAMAGAGMVPAAADVGGLLQPGANELEIECRAWGASGEEEALWGAYARPEAIPPGRLPPGLIGPVRLVLFDGVLITGVRWQVRLDQPLGPGAPPPPVAHMRCQVRYVAASPFRGRCRLRLTPLGFDAPAVEVVRDVSADDPQGSWELWCSVPEPRLWTVWERGTPHLYRLAASVERPVHRGTAVGAHDGPSGRDPGSRSADPGAGGDPAAQEEGSGPTDDRTRRAEGRGSPGSAPWLDGGKPVAAPWWEGLVGVRTLERREGVFYLNGEPLFCRGACVVPVDGWPGAVDPRRARAWVRRARALHLNAVRIYAHRAHPAVYEAASRLGLIIWQDLPWTGRPVPAAAAILREQLPGWVDTVGCWPAVSVWAASQEPAVPGRRQGGVPAGSGAATRGRAPKADPAASGMASPSPGGEAVSAGVAAWHRARQALEGMRGMRASHRRAARRVAQELSQLDPSRPVVPRAGALSWWRQEGDARLFPAAPVPPPGSTRAGKTAGGGGPGAGPERRAGLGRGASGVPASQWLWAWKGDPARWLRLVPHAATLVSSFGAPVWEDPLPPSAVPAGAGRRGSRPGETRARRLRASQCGQAAFVRSMMESLRRRKLQPAGGGFVYALNGTGQQPCYGLYDPGGRPRPAARAYREACRPVRLLVDRLPRRLRPGQRFRLPVWLVNDTPVDVTGRWTWELRSDRRVIAAQTGDCRVAANGLAPAGWIVSRWPVGEPGPLWLRLVLATADGEAAVSYRLSERWPAAVSALRLEPEAEGDAGRRSGQGEAPKGGLDVAPPGEPGRVTLGRGGEPAAAAGARVSKARDREAERQEAAGAVEAGDAPRPFWVLRRAVEGAGHGRLQREPGGFFSG